MVDNTFKNHHGHYPSIHITNEELKQSSCSMNHHRNKEGKQDITKINEHYAKCNICGLVMEIRKIK